MVGVGHPVTAQYNVRLFPTRMVTLGAMPRGRNLGGSILLGGGNTVSCPDLLRLVFLSILFVATHLMKGKMLIFCLYFFE